MQRIAVGSKPRIRLQTSLGLVVVLGRHIIGIENKIWHHTEGNPFATYQKAIDTRASPEELRRLCVVLSVRAEPDAGKDEGFINVTYNTFFDKLKELMGQYAIGADTKYLAYLNDFMQTIEELKGRSVMSGTMAFFREHHKQVEALIAAYEQCQKELGQRVVELRDQVANQAELERDNDSIRQWIWKNCCLVHDFKFSTGITKLDAAVSMSGWKVLLWPWRQRARQDLDAVLADLERRAESFEVDAETGRHVIAEYDLDDDLECISTKVSGLVQKIRQCLEDSRE